MPTSVITGRDLALTINSVSYDAQATSVALTVEQTREIYQTLDGRAYKVTDANSTLTVEMLADWGATGSLCESLWTASNSAPNTAIAFSFTAATGAVFTGNVFPTFPSPNGTAPDAQTVTFSTATAFQAGERVDILRDGAGTVTINAASTAVSILGRGTAGTAYAIGTRYDAVSVVCVATNSYRIIGGATAV